MPAANILAHTSYNASRAEFGWYDSAAPTSRCVAGSSDRAAAAPCTRRSTRRCIVGEAQLEAPRRRFPTRAAHVGDVPPDDDRQRPRLLLAVHGDRELGLGRGEPVADTQQDRRAAGGDDLERATAHLVDRLDEHPLSRRQRQPAGNTRHTDVGDRRVSESDLAAAAASERGDVTVGNTSDSVPCGAGNITAARPSTTCAASMRRTVPSPDGGYWHPCRYRRRRPILII